jgi:TatD DNase family protein
LLVDTHCHLGHIEADPELTLADAHEVGVDVVVDIGMGTEESSIVAERAHRFDGVYASVGVHPNDLGEFEADRDGTMQKLASLAAAEPRVVAIGETGLDFYRHRSPSSLQEDAFRAHISLARETDLALVIHCRDAHRRVLEILDETGAPERVVMHCFSGDEEYARECTARNYFCSFAGNVTFRNADGLRAAAAAMPLRLLLAETDAPFLAPEPHRGRPNAPRLLPRTAEALATAVGSSLEEFRVVLRSNSARAFRLDLS